MKFLLLQFLLLQSLLLQFLLLQFLLLHFIDKWLCRSVRLEQHLNLLSLFSDFCVLLLSERGQLLVFNRLSFNSQLVLLRQFQNALLSLFLDLLYPQVVILRHQLIFLLELGLLGLRSFFQRFDFGCLTTELRRLLINQVGVLTELCLQLLLHFFHVLEFLIRPGFHVGELVKLFLLRSV